MRFDEHMDKIDSMKKYNMESMSAFKKTIMQSKSRGFMTGPMKFTLAIWN